MDDWTKIIGLLISIITLTALFTGALEKIILTLIYWIRREPVIVIRKQSVEEFDHIAKYFLRFSVINRRDKAITLNDVRLYIGDYVYGSTIPGMCWLGIKTFSREIQLSFVGQPNDTPFPVLNLEKREQSMGTSTFSLINERGSLEPHEQVDIDVIVKLSRPQELKGKYRNIWALGGQIEVRYEKRSLRELSILYPSRDKPLPF